MSYINVGAWVAVIAYERPKTKTALKKALADPDVSVTFDITSALGPRGTERHIDGTVKDIGSDKLSVVGPDPFTNRAWYATVEVVNGKLRVT